MSYIRLDLAFVGEEGRFLHKELFPSQMTHLSQNVLQRSRQERWKDSPFESYEKNIENKPLMSVPLHLTHHLTGISFLILSKFTLHSLLNIFSDHPSLLYCSARLKYHQPKFSCWLRLDALCSQRKKKKKENPNPFWFQCDSFFPFVRLQ